MKKFAFLFLSVFCIFAKAQVPGYLGKKNSFGYEPSFGVAYMNPNSHLNVSTLGIFGRYDELGYDTPNPKFLAFNVSHTFVYDRIVKRNASFNASFSFFKSEILFKEYVINVYDPINFSTSSTYVSGGNAKVSGFAVNIAYRTFRNQLAPLGLYLGYSLGFASSSAMVHNSYTDTTVFKKANVVTPKFCYMYGRQNVFFDKLIIDRGFSFDMFGFLLGFIAKNRAKNFDGSTSGSSPDAGFVAQLKARMYYRDMVTFYIGAKYMF